MQCVILAAGMGVRMRPLTLDRPKPLVEVGGRPLVEHVLDALPDSITSLVFVVHYRGEQIREHFGGSYRGRSVIYVDQVTANGTGGALRAARPVLGERFMVVLADDLHGAPALQELTRYPLAILGAISPTPERYGVLTVEDGILVGIEEKPQRPRSNLVNTGAMVLDQRIFAYETPTTNGEVFLTDLVTGLAHDAHVHVVAQPRWCPIGYPEDLPKGEAFLRDGGHAPTLRT